MAYRDELEALKERHALLERNLQEIVAAARTLEATRAQEAEVREQLAASAARLKAMSRDPKRDLPLLDNVRVASPCPAEWSKMYGSDRVRHCNECEKNVYDLSQLTREEAETFLREKEGTALCITYFQRADGTVMTSDCEVGVSVERRNRRLRSFAFAAIGGLMLAYAAHVATLACTKVETRVMGARGVL